MIHTLKELCSVFDLRFPDLRGDGVAFAKWVCDELEWFGDLRTMSRPAASAAFADALNFYQREHHVRGDISDP